VTLSASLTGNTPNGGYQWQVSDNATYTNNIAGATNSTYTIYDAASSAYYRLAATNSVGAGATAFAQLTVTASGVVQMQTIGTADPAVSGSDIAQLSTVGMTGNFGGANYYTDNTGTPPSQTFLTGTNGNGYFLPSLYIKFGNDGSEAAGNTYLSADLFDVRHHGHVAHHLSRTPTLPSAFLRTIGQNGSA